MSVVKQRLKSLLPDIRIFLDVDDLEEINLLEEYVDQSGCVLVFLSRGYFVTVHAAF